MSNSQDPTPTPMTLKDLYAGDEEIRLLDDTARSLLPMMIQMTARPGGVATVGSPSPVNIDFGAAAQIAYTAANALVMIRRAFLSQKVQVNGAEAQQSPIRLAE